MRIRLKKPYGFSVPGDLLDPDEPVARILIERGIAERAEIETKLPSAPPRDKAIASPAKKRN